MTQGSPGVARATILALVRFGLASEAEVKGLERGWKKYRQATNCDLNGKPGAAGGSAIGCKIMQDLRTVFCASAAPKLRESRAISEILPGAPRAREGCETSQGLARSCAQGSGAQEGAAC